ncbi:stage VI sporulation protein F [Paenibacillus sp. N3.4]|uniref:stage VI sporulation protein F n=1 Tax=Paenibacillus sp. N3.4 TaxID=2603222 RepID=UPI0011CC1AFF|nr:stage VI sporulation protein F [Paenibacillus sp. N3.4]TXK85682.1 serine/threonine protein kinase [Paenibacillus sp. N3.4]
MHYRNYEIDPALVERVKVKMKDTETKERVKVLLQGVTKADLQKRAEVARLLGAAVGIYGEKLSESQTSSIIDFIVAQKIDPTSTLHLIRLWAMFR